MTANDGGDNVASVPVAEAVFSSHAPSVTATGHRRSDLPSAAIEATAFPVQAINADGDLANIESATVAVIANAPTAQVSDNHQSAIGSAAIELTAFPVTASVAESEQVGFIFSLNGGYALEAYAQESFSLDGGFAMDAYVSEGFLPLSDAYALNAYAQESFSLDGGFALDAYRPKVSAVGGRYGIRVYAPVSFALDAAFALSAAFLDSRFTFGAVQALGAYVPYVVDVQAGFALNAFAEGRSALDARQRVDRYRLAGSAVDGRYGLSAFSPGQSALDARFRLAAFIGQSTAALDGRYDLLTYTPVMTVAGGQYGLAAFQRAITFVMAQYGLDASGGFYGWIVNLDTLAVSRYEGFGFNSLSGEFGAMDDGIYELSGESIDGEPVQAFIRLRTDFGSNRLKRVRYAYLDAASSGAMQLSVTAQNKRIDYAVPPKDELSVIKKTLALGPKDRFWDVTIGNAEGSDFELAAVELVEQDTGRRK
ncbi:MAG: hypothetical protein IBX56_16265 [Methylomicrobium sp.]|nr:hypothetical protein [Methylomicrobium sp.]